MARVIPKSSGKDVLDIIKWKEFVVIYANCLFFTFFIICKNVLLSLKRYIGNHFAPTRQHIAHKFPALSLISRGDRKVSKHQHSIGCPRQLMDPQLGTSKYMKLKTTKLHYVESGDENERAVLLLHGFPDCFFGWRYQIPTISRYHRVLALDLKGFNDSDKPMLRHNYRPNVICEELKDFLDALSIKTCIIIGHDLGGLIGWVFALKFPDYVSKFIAISAPNPNLYWKQLATTALISRKWCSMVQMPFIPENELKNSLDFVKKFYGHLESASMSMEMEMENGDKCEGKELIETYKYIFNSREDWTGPLNYFRNFMFYQAKPNSMLRCQTVIIAGNKDPNYKLETIIKSGELADAPHLKIIEGAGHFPHQSHWKELNDILLQYIGGAKRRQELLDEGLPVQRGLVGRMINKMYGVSQLSQLSQHYGNLNAKMF